MNYSIYKISIKDYCTNFFENMDKELVTTTTNWQDMVKKVNNGTENFKEEGNVLIGACINNHSLLEEKCHPCIVSGSELHNQIATDYWNNLDEIKNTECYK